MNSYSYKKLIGLLYAAQIASDAGKGIYDLPANNEFEKNAAWRGYGIKDELIKKAILICQHEDVPCIYSIQRGKDQNGNSSWIIYFDLKGGKRNRQISFHSFSNRFKTMKKGKAAHWQQHSGKEQSGHVRFSIRNEYQEAFGNI